jgi:cell division septum initiation protein DivIVA
VDISDTRLVQRLHSAELPRGLRGFDETATRQLLNEAASAYAKACEQRDTARGELHIAKQRLSGQMADAEAVGRAILTATATGEQIVAAANDHAARLIDQVKAEADRLLSEARAAGEQVEATREQLEREREAERQRLAAAREDLLASARAESDRQLADARAEADKQLAQAHSEVARLRRETKELAAYLESKRADFAEGVSTALERLKRIGRPSDDALLADLNPAEPRP